MDNTPASSIHFECSACGECCSSFHLPIEKEKAEILLSKAWVQSLLETWECAIEPVTPTMSRLPLKPDQTCVFLSEEKRCLIHQHEGITLKPEECKRFPFAAIVMPPDATGDSNIAFDVSASCKTVAESLLRHFLPIVPPEGELITPHELLFPHTISMARYNETLSQIKAVLNPDAVTGQNTPSFTRLMERLSKIRQTLQSQQLSKKKPFNSFLFNILARCWLRLPYGSYSRWSLWVGGTVQDPKLFGTVSMSVRDIERIPLDNLSEATLQQLSGFVYSLQSRKVLLSYGHSLQDLWVLSVISIALTAWYARALAFLQNRPQPEASDWSLAIRLVERYYSGHQPWFLESIRRWGRLWFWVLSLIF
ncbi:MAG: YkgJ family cysteine cluster protein [Cyanobacteria bacterium]|nr:YkgJ family cysteine cluster protein [Cyanobacteriota bacterium]